MILLKTTISQYEDTTIQLIGSDSNRNISELEKMKVIVSQIRREIIKTPSDSIGNSQSNKGTTSSRLQGVVNKNLNELKDTNALKECRRKLLRSNPELQKLFQSMVQSIPPLVSEEDFWSSHQEELQQQEESMHRSDRGRPSGWMSEVVHQSEDGSVLITLERKMNTFLLYPQIRIAFEAEVPLRMSEEDFWKRCILHDLFNSDHRVPHRMSNPNIIDTTSITNTTSNKMSTNSNSNNMCTTKQRSVSSVVRPEVDLTSSHFTSSSSDNTTTTTSLSSSEVIRNLNRSSCIVIGGNDFQSASQWHRLPIGTTNEEVEPQPRHFLPLHLQHLLVDGPQNEEVQDSSAFRLRPPPAPLSTSNNDKKEVEEENEELLTSNRWKLFHIEVNKKRKREGGSAGPLPSSSNNTTSFSDSSSNNTTSLPEDFRQEMLERFSQLTELLRFFHSILGTNHSLMNELIDCGI